MKSTLKRIIVMAAGFLVLMAGVFPFTASARNRGGESQPRLIQPAELVKLLQGSGSQRPLILQVGFRTLYEQAHIPGSEYLQPASQEEGKRELHKRVQALPRGQFIVLYCGCCPWSHCPNVRPAYQELEAMGFRNVKVLYIENNFGADWVEKGYPVSKGK
jgi:thiosulfate/3-mercaptopyruvate sulfurtransferase